MKIILIITMMILGSSCVGTIKDANSKDGQVLNTGDKIAPISFAGLIQANPIAHNKIELFFFPAHGDQNTITYEIYINGSPIASKLSGKALSINSKGMMSTVITNLTMNTTYNFNMKAIDAGSSNTSTLDPSKALSATTFSNQTADFAGISSVVLGAGESGKTTVIVNWLAAVTLGSSISPKANDPVAYEVKYISQLGGISNLNNIKYTGPDRVTFQNPTTLSTSPSLATDTTMTINGLNPGTIYYFQVRAVHKNYAINGADPTYKREENTKYLFIKTLDSSGVFDFATNQVLLSNPVGEDGLTKLNVAWLPASGAFNHYRVCYTKVANANIQPDLVPIDDHLIDTSGFLINNCLIKSADDNFHQLLSLDSYAYYQVKVVACKTALCDFGNRIMSDLMQKRVFTNVAPFGGILSFENPVDEAALDNIKMFFNPPIVSAGYINKFRMYCYANASDTNPARIDNIAQPTVVAGKPNCNGISIQTTFPSSTADFANFAQVELTLPTNAINGINQFCFSLVPTIESANLTQSDVQNAIVKCFIPQIKTPNILQFPGRAELCSVIGKNLQITWPTPTNGLYSKYTVFYQAKPTGAEFFDFQAAINEYTANTSINYKWIDNIDKALISQMITGLVPGTKYNIGVLPYLNYHATKMWGQINYSVGECSLPLPKARFQEWMQVISVGPKEDGLTPVDSFGKRRFILETLNSDDVPVEIKTTTADTRVPDPADPLAVTKTGSINFDGIYGRYDSVATNPMNQYSNSGIVKITWKDVSLYSDTDYLNNYLDTGVASKNARKYGYRVYRSDDNKLTWKDLTFKGAVNPNQGTLNAGLIQNYVYTWSKRNNLAATNSTVSSFTDYSVKFSGSNGETDLARTYFYKIIPVFNGKELVYDDTTNPNHNIIKVVLPPRNMALVHRMMANRSICNEMDLPIKKTTDDNYSCDYDGVGSKGLNPPFAVGNTVYDQGGDLLMDRFELGVTFTRGDPSTSNSNSDWSGNKLDFKGSATNGSKFSGCFNNGTAITYEPKNGVGLSTGSYAYQNIIPGDCIGRDVPTIAADKSTACSDPLKAFSRYYIYPGSPGSDETPNCTNQLNTGLYFTDLSKPNSYVLTDNDFAQTQSEFAATYFIRNGNANGFGYDTKTLFNFPAGNSKYIKFDNDRRLGMSFINIPYADGTNLLHPRWIPLNRIFGNLSFGTIGASYSAVGSYSLYDKTITQIVNSGLYDTTTVLAPSANLISSTRFNKDTTQLARVVTSNASKLPPAQGLSHNQFHQICSTYKLQVGFETTANGFHSLLGSTPLSKRMMRKKEHIAASAWPEKWNNAKVTAIEKGLDVGTKGCNGVSKVTPNGTSILNKNSVIDNFIAWAGSATPFALTGSSGNFGTEDCTSKYGVQDLAGNVREYTSDQFFCNYLDPSPLAHKPTIYIGDIIQKDVNHSVKYNGSFVYDHTTATPWISGFADSGTCSSVEIGGNRGGSYTSGGAFNSVFLPDSTVVDNTVVTKTKSFDQSSVLTNRNGDGSFLDFGIDNIGPVLNGQGAFQLPGLYFNVPLGMPVGCSSGCASGAGADNKLIATDYHAALPGSNYLPVETPIANFPINNSTFTNYGVEDFNESGDVSSNDEALPFPYQYVSGVNDTGIQANNTLNFSTLNSASPSPGTLYHYYFKVDRSWPMRFTVGGSAQNEPGRYTFFMDGSNDYDDRLLSDRGGRCVYLIEE